MLSSDHYKYNTQEEFSYNFLLQLNAILCASQVTDTTIFLEIHQFRCQPENKSLYSQNLHHMAMIMMSIYNIFSSKQTRKIREVKKVLENPKLLTINVT